MKKSKLNYRQQAFLDQLVCGILYELTLKIDQGVLPTSLDYPTETPAPLMDTKKEFKKEFYRRRHLRSFEDIIKAGAYETEKYRPSPTSKIVCILIH
jgi:hypothetical protein